MEKINSQRHFLFFSFQINIKIFIKVDNPDNGLLFSAKKK